MNNVYCVMPFVHIKQFQNHIYGPCCEFENPIHQKINNISAPRVTSENNNKAVSLTDSFNSNYFKHIRKEMIEGNIPAGCERCVNKEKMNVGSYRQWANKEFHTDNFNVEQPLSEIRGLDISFSNECNLTCRMCQPSYSTKWNGIWDNFSSIYNKEWSLSQHEGKSTWKIKAIDPLLLPNLEYLKIMGGEPFIGKDHNTFIQNLSNENISNIFFEYNTNATIYPENDILNKLSKAKGGVIKLSIDGIGALNEYIRPGVKWSVIDNVVKQWFDFTEQNPAWEIQFAPCWQALNIHCLEEYILYAQQFNKNGKENYPWIGSNRVLTPEPLTIYVLPEKYKKLLIKKYKKNDSYPSLRKTLIEFLSLEYGENQGSHQKLATMQDFYEYNSAMDIACKNNIHIELDCDV